MCGTRTLSQTALILLAGSLLSGPAAPAYAQTFQLEETTIEGAQRAMQSGELTCHQLVQGYLDRIAAYDKQGPRLNGIQTLNPRALQEADSLDQALRSGGPTGPLHCVPVLVKDQIETSDMPTTYGSVLFKDFVPRRDATNVRRLREAGAIILAKTNMGEFASRYVGSAYGIIRNAYDPRRNPSGSSGGTATGVAANFGLVGIGEDTSGSIQGPAAVHSLVGLRPTVALVSRAGMMPANPTTDTMGPITRTVRDAAALLDVMAGYDPRDPVTAWSWGHVPDSYQDSLDPAALQGARIGVIRAPMDPNTDTSSADYQKVKAVMDRAVADLRTLGAEVVDSVRVPDLRRVNAVLAADVFETEEATDAYLAGHPNAPYKTFRSIVLSGKVIPWRAVGMAEVMGHTTRDPGFYRYLATRDTLRQGVIKLMADQRLDALVFAAFDHTTTLIAPDVETNPNPEDEYGLGDNRSLSALLDFPVLTVPAGFTPEGLPVGLEMMGRPFSEAELLGYGYAYEEMTHRRRPPSTTPPLDRR